MDAHIASIARKYFDPRTWQSGTEQMAPFLYSMIRMTRPASVVEYGAGYTTLFILQALADNIADFAAEREDLVRKTRASGLLERDAPSVSWREKEFQQWFGGPGRASAADPAYYTAPYRPHLYCFDNNPVGHRYVVALQSAVAEANLSHLFSLGDGATMGPDALPEHAKPIDLVWWDYPEFERCYRLFWSAVNPNGGLMMWHDVASGLGNLNWQTFLQLTRGKHDDMEALVFCQPNKIDQNSCAVLRRKTSYVPPFERATAAAQLHAASVLVNDVQHGEREPSERVASATRP